MSASKSILTDKENAVSYLSSPTITIHVGGEDRRKFFIHRDLLTSRSRFFAKALRSYQDGAESSSNNTEAIQWKEGEEGTIEMPDDDPAVFEAYVQLIYRDHLPICYPVAKQPTLPVETPTAEVEKAKKAFENNEIKKTNQEYQLLAKLYVLAEKLRDIASKESLLHAFVESTTKLRYDNITLFPDKLTISLTYNGTMPGDPLREFLTDCYVLIGHSDWTGTSSTAFPQEFLFDIVVGMYKTRPRPLNTSKIKDAKVYVEKLKADGE